MGSLRNPVGPLPSSIYWRRRAVLASVAALLALIAVWTVSSGGSKVNDNGKGSGGPDPVASITPGAPGKGPAITAAPGGRDETGGGGTGSGGGSASAGTGGDSGGGKNGDPGAGTGGSSGGAGTDGGSGAAADRVPADSQLPTCAPNSLRWEVKSAKNAYEAGERPRLELVARNLSGTSCKVDLGPKQAVLTIIEGSSSKAVWSSEHCPSGPGNVFYRVQARGQTSQSLEWDRKFSAAGQCQTPPEGSAAAGTYMVEVKAPGMPVAQISFVLKQD